MAKEELTPRKRMLIFINIMITCVASSMLATALNTALPPILEDFQISATQGQWLTSGYSLVMAIIMPLTAFLINRFPTRKLYISAIGIFLTGLAVCAVAPNFLIMMVGRIIQASGNGMITAMTQVLILSIFPEEEQGTYMGWYGLSVGAAPVIAPTIAGIVVDHWGWRMIFLASMVIMVVSLVWALKVFSNLLDTVRTHFDIYSFILSALAFGGVTLGIGNIGTYGLFSPAVLIELGVGIVAGVLFTYRQFNLNEPFLDLSLLKDKDYAVSVIGSMFLYFIMMGSSILLPLYVQNTLGLSATESGLVTLPGSLTMALMSPVAGKVFDKIGIRPLFIGGAVALIISNVGMCLITLQTSVWIAAFYNVIRSVAIGLLMMPLVTWGAGRIHGQRTSHATALLTSLRTIAGAIGSSVFVAVMTMVADHSISTGAVASMEGVKTAFFYMAVASVVMLVIAILTTRKSQKTQSDTIETETQNV